MEQRQSGGNLAPLRDQLSQVTFVPTSPMALTPSLNPEHPPDDPPAPGKVWAWESDPGYWMEVNCGTCRDVLWFRRGDFPIGHPDFGKMDRCPDCADFTPAQLKARGITAGMSEAGFVGRDAKSLLTFDPQKQPFGDARQAATEAKRSVQTWAARSGPEFLVLVGKPGVGKSHLGEGAIGQVVANQQTARYVIWEDFAHHAKDNLESFHDYLGQLRNTEWLVIDDVGQAYESARAYLSATLHEIVGHRFHWNKRTLVAGNLAPDQGQNRQMYWGQVLGDRFASRVTDKSRVKIISLWACADLRATL